MKNPLSKRMTALVTSLLIGGGVGGGVYVTQDDVMNQFLDEKEGNVVSAYKDGSGIWTICRGVTTIDGKPVKAGMRLSKEQCNVLNAKEAQKSLDWVKANVKVPLNPVQQVAIASFCPYNLGPNKCRYNANGTKTRFWQALERGDWKEACNRIPDWVFDKGRDCRKTQGQKNGCYGQVERREQEKYMCLLTLGDVKNGI